MIKVILECVTLVTEKYNKVICFVTDEICNAVIVTVIEKK